MASWACHPSWPSGKSGRLNHDSFHTWKFLKTGEEVEIYRFQEFRFQKFRFQIYTSFSFKSYTTQAIGNFKKSTTAKVTSQTKGLLSSTMAVNARYNRSYWYSMFWTEICLQLMLMPRVFSNANEIYFFFMIFPRILQASSSPVLRIRIWPILGTFLCRPLQNNNVKWPNFALPGERKPRRLIF